ncbi:MAG: SGNH/GDSL hydrolase family protein [Gemmatimonadaceae bacterium]
MNMILLQNSGSRRALLVAVMVGTSLLTSCMHTSVNTSGGSSLSMPTWISTWAPSQSATALRPAAGAVDRVPTYANATIRQVLHTTVGGDRVRIHISNEYGDRPLAIGGAHIALTATGSSINAGSDHALTFDGKSSVIVRTGAVVVSDPIQFNVPPLTSLTVSMFLPDSARTTTRHALAVATTYISKSGNQLVNTDFKADTTMRSWLFLAAVEITNPQITGTIVLIGNSITDGFAATVDANRRWPDVLAQRLLTSTTEPMKAVVNAGISGNRVLSFGAGPSLVSRFDRDVLMQPGVTHVVIMEGINDISRSNVDTVSADDIIFGYKQMIARAHERGIVAIGATLTPFDRAPAPNEEKRQAVNKWIRTSGMYDAVIDFDAITRDPAKPNKFLPAYDSGDGLHPSDAGYKAMGEAIDLALFRKRLQRQ